MQRPRNERPRNSKHLGGDLADRRFLFTSFGVLNMSELEKTVADILVKASNAAESAGKFAMEQLPDIAQQYVLFQGLWSAALCLFCAAYIAAFFFSVKPVSKWAAAGGYLSDRDMGYFFYWMFGITSVAISALVFLDSIKTAILAFFAPKILLIQWAATLVK